MSSSQLNAAFRTESLTSMSDEIGLDILVVGGGVTGAGIALDAASRGLRVGIVEAQDWAAGTSSRSSKLIHGGLRYLYNLDFKLVAEALKERGLLLRSIAPHLVKAQPFLWPLKMPVIERTYSAVGVGMYDALALIGAGGKKTVPFQQHLSKAQAKEVFPDVRDDALVGAIKFYDARVDDARLVLTLIRTAVKYGAYAASRTQVVDMVTGDGGKVTGVVAKDLETGTEYTIRAEQTINATGVWTEETQNLSKGSGGLKVLASKGIHIVVPKDRIEGTTGMFLRTEKSVLFIIPWPDYWVIGTTDTPWNEEIQHPVATKRDIDYVLDHANAVLSSNLTHEDIIGTSAGLRPLLQPGTKDKTKSTKVSREHTVTRPAEGLTSIAGGKLTTYRVMAEDAVDFALGKETARQHPSVTSSTPLVGAEGYFATEHTASRVGAKYGWDSGRMEHLLSRYGALIDEITSLVDRDPALANPLETAPGYLAVEVAYAVTHEGALHLEDILKHRVRLHLETRDRGVSSLDEIAGIAAPLLGWDEETTEHEKANYREIVAAGAAAEEQLTDSAATAARLRARDLRPLEPLEPLGTASK